MAKKSGGASLKGPGSRPGPEEKPRRRSRALPVLGILGLALVLAASALLIGRGRGLLRSRAASGHNLLLITLDTTRADHLGCYGYSQARTPNLDGLAREGICFARCY